MRCVYCYNPDIVFGKGKFSIEQTLKFLSTRKNLLDGVVLSGGECTSHKSIKHLLQEIKKLGFLVKIDTNGSHPEKIKSLIEENLVDYIALDFKSTKEKFYSITKSNLFEEFVATLKHLTQIQFPFEVRTTIHSELLIQSEVQQMIRTLELNGYSNTFYLQHYRNDSETIGKIENSQKNYLNIGNLNASFKLVSRNEN
jgi:pyruvate formate lyase activating enzyme